jgi:hypothetical protein
MERNCDDAPCACSEAVLKARLEQITLARAKEQDKAELRRLAFVKQQWPRKNLWHIAAFLPLGAFLLITRIMPQMEHMYHDWFAYGVAILTSVLMLIVYRKHYVIDVEFQKYHPEDADILFRIEDEEDD